MRSIQKYLMFTTTCLAAFALASCGAGHKGKSATSSLQAAPLATSDTVQVRIIDRSPEGKLVGRLLSPSQRALFSNYYEAHIDAFNKLICTYSIPPFIYGQPFWRFKYLTPKIQGRDITVTVSKSFWLGPCRMELKWIDLESHKPIKPGNYSAYGIVLGIHLAPDESPHSPEGKMECETSAEDGLASGFCRGDKAFYRDTDQEVVREVLLREPS